MNQIITRCWCRLALSLLISMAPRDLKHYFSEKDFIFSVKREGKTSSLFDDQLRERWFRLMDEGRFRYKLPSSDSIPTRRTSGPLNLLVQLNPSRGQRRRPPQVQTTLHQPFSDDAFNFLKIPPEEIIMEPVIGGGGDANQAADAPTDLLLINVSPIEVGHSLFVPDVAGKHPQLISAAAQLRRALRTMLLSGDASFRLGFNSLCAYASVNHLHFHFYYLDARLLLETIPMTEALNEDIGVFSLKDYSCFALALDFSSTNEMNTVADVVARLARLCLEKDLAYNLYATRGTPLTTTKETVGVADDYSVVRIFFWPRKKILEAKRFGEEVLFNLATCELAGHVLTFSRSAFDNLDEKSAAEVYENSSLDEETLKEFVDFVKSL